MNLGLLRSMCELALTTIQPESFWKDFLKLVDVAEAAETMERNFEEHRDCECCACNSAHVAEIRKSLAALEAV